MKMFTLSDADTTLYSSDILSIIWEKTNGSRTYVCSVRDFNTWIVFSTDMERPDEFYSSLTDEIISIFPELDNFKFEDIQHREFVGFTTLATTTTEIHLFDLHIEHSIVHANDAAEWFLLQCKYPDIMRIY